MSTWAPNVLLVKITKNKSKSKALPGKNLEVVDTLPFPLSWERVTQLAGWKNHTNPHGAFR